MSTRDLLRPVTWDDLYYHHRGDLAGIAALTEARYTVRAAHAYFALTADGAGTLRRLQGVTAAPAAGVKLLALCACEHYSRVRRRGFALRGHTPLELEEGVYGFWALSIAYADQGNAAAAAHALEHALLLAGALGLSGRTQVLRLELERQRTLAGSPDADAVLRTLRRTQETHVRGFGREVYVTALLGQGRYHDAYRAAKRQHLRDGLVQFTAALAGAQPLAAAHPSPLGELALAVRALGGGVAWSVPTLGDDPFRVYAALTASAQLFLAGDPAWAFLRLPSPGAPDQQAFAAVLAWAIWLHCGQAHQRPLALPGAVVRTLGALTAPDEVTALLVRLFPNELTVLELLGVAPSAVKMALGATPRLGHGSLSVGPHTVKLHRATSETLLLDGLDGGNLWAGLHRQEKSRYTHKLAELGYTPNALINPATVCRLTAVYESAVRRAGRSGDLEQAERALAHAHGLLPAYLGGCSYTLPPFAA